MQPFYWPSLQYYDSEEDVNKDKVVLIFEVHSKLKSFNFLLRLKDAECNVKPQLNVLGRDIPTMMQIPA